MDAKVLIAALAFSASAFGAPYDPVLMLRNSADQGNDQIIPSPSKSAPSFWVYDYTQTPKVVFYTLGSGFTVSGGVVSVTSTAPAWASITGKPSFFSGAYADLTGKPTLFSGAYADLTGKPALFSGSYVDLTNKPTLFSGAYADLTGKPALFNGAYSSLTGIPTTFPPSAHTHDAADITSGVLADARIPFLAISKTTGLQTALDGKFPNPTGTTAQYIRGDGSLATFPARSFSTPARTLNTAYQPSATRDTQVTCGVDVSVTSLILAGSRGSVYLEYADNAAMSTNLVTVNSGTNATGGVLNITNVSTITLTGLVPSGKYIRLRTAVDTGSPTFAIRSCQEVTL